MKHRLIDPLASPGLQVPLLLGLAATVSVMASAFRFTLPRARR